MRCRLEPLRIVRTLVWVTSFRSGAEFLAPGDMNYQLSKMTLLGHILKSLKSVNECKFTIHHRSDPVHLDETIHVFEMFA
jgi:hypothetical protein